MKKNLILRMIGTVIEYNNGEHVYYLAGPNEGGDGWQKKAIEIINNLDSNALIVCPCDCNHCKKFREFSLSPSYTKIKSGGKRGVIANALHFPNESAWKKHYMEEASYHGSIIFWLPTKKQLQPGEDNTPYAVDVYSEIAAWGVKSANPDCFSKDKEVFKGGRINMVVGAEDGFPNLQNIKDSLDLEHNMPYLVCNSLEETIEKAVELAKRTNPFPAKLN